MDKLNAEVLSSIRKICKEYRKNTFLEIDSNTNLHLDKLVANPLDFILSNKINFSFSAVGKFKKKNILRVIVRGSLEEFHNQSQGVSEFLTSWYQGPNGSIPKHIFLEGSESVMQHNPVFGVCIDLEKAGEYIAHWLFRKEGDPKAYYIDFSNLGKPTLVSELKEELADYMIHLKHYQEYEQGYCSDSQPA